MGFYEFKSDDAFRFAKTQFIKTRERGNEFQFEKCPYCHSGESGKDRYTFSISLTTGQFKCLRASCGVQGNFITLARDFNFSLGNEVKAYYTNKNTFYQFKKDTKVDSHDKAIAYMKKRGISDAITKKYDITVRKEAENILIFPFYDEKGILRYLKYRKTDFDKEKDKGNKEWAFALKDKDGRIIQSCMPILFGMKQCNDKFDRLVITEGQIDSLSVAEAGIDNAVSVPTGAKGFTWVPYCWDWFSKFQELIVFGDNENGEITLLVELKKRFPKIVKSVQIEDYKGCKDANEILVRYGKDAIKYAVNNAKALPVKYVKKLADVKAVDIYSIPKLETGIRDIDRLIGGLYYGQVIILTGKRGDGKSTFMSQLIAETLEQEKKVFVYSGELQDYFFKRWLDMQLAGPRRVITNVKDGIKKYLLSNSTVDKINDWYRDKIYIYDNSIIEDDELEDLLKTIESVIMQYGINLVCIDNLMTALDVGMDVDLYRSQSKFVNRLCKIAKRYDAVIILVAHPRKNSWGEYNDDVSGSADITNRVDLVMSYKRGKDNIPEDERLLVISKNRLTGQLTKGDGIRLKYNQASKRITGTFDDVTRAYGWEKEIDGFMQLSVGEDTPFGSVGD